MEQKNFQMEWVMMNLRLSGSGISGESAQRIAEGGYDLTATLEEHQLVAGLIDVLPLMDLLLGLREELSAPTLDRFYQKVSGGESPSYRRRTPVLFHLSYNPVLPTEIPGELKKLFRLLHGEDRADGTERAVYVHNEIIRIWPFEQYSDIIARAALEYELLYGGFPPCPLTLSETEYNSALAGYLRTGRETVIAENLRMNLLMRQEQYTRREK
ncbi:MAG: Fic family protein [Emergencia sp.]